MTRIRAFGSKLQLNKTTLRSLSAVELRDIGGAGINTEAGKGCSNSCEILTPEPGLVADPADLQKAPCSNIKACSEPV